MIAETMLVRKILLLLTRRNLHHLPQIMSAADQIYTARLAQFSLLSDLLLKTSMYSDALIAGIFIEPT